MSVDSFAILALVGTILAITMPWPRRTFGTQIMCWPTLDSYRVPHQTLSPVSKPSWRNTLRDTFNFSSFSGMPNHPSWDPSFSFYLWFIGGSISLSL